MTIATNTPLFFKWEHQRWTLSLCTAQEQLSISSFLFTASSHQKVTIFILNLLYKLHKMEGVVYTKEPFSSPENVLKYLGRYTHRFAISDARIKAFDNGMVTFEYTDRKDSCKKKLSTISADEFILRFCMHVLLDNSLR